MAVPFIDLRRFESDFLERWADIADHVTRNTMFVGGPEVSRLEDRLRERSGTAGVVACANGTDAIQLALRAVGVGPGDTVLLPDATFWATFEAIVNVGARPVTVDIEWTSLQLDFDLFAQAVERYQPKAAILVHLYGWGTPRLAEFRTFCRERGIPLVEDGAQAFDVAFGGDSIYKGSQIATVSFYPAKVLGSCGDAGAVYCESEELTEKIRLLGNHGRTAHYGHGVVGWNSRMAGFDAAWLNLCLDYAEDRIASRRKVAAAYREAFLRMGVCHVGPPEGYLENGYLSVALFDPEVRPAVIEVLKDKGIGFGTVYPGAMSRQPGAEGHLAGSVGGEVADKACRSVLNLPLFAYMGDEEVAEVLEALESALAKTGAAT